MDEYPYDDLKTNPKCIRLCIITHPFPSEIAGHTLLSNFVKILLPVSDNLFVITGISSFEDMKRYENIHILNVKSTRKPLLVSIFRYILAQLKISAKLIRNFREIDVVIFFLGTDLIFPTLVAFFLNKKIIIIATGLGSKSAAKTYNKRLFGMGGVIFPCIFRMLEYVNFHLADQIVAEYEGAIDFMGLNKYRKKLSANCTLYIDFNLFKVKKDFKDRRNLIGYTGRLSAEKGVLNFVKAIPLILKERGDLEFLICGDGPLFDEIKKELNNNGSYDKVELTGWIPHDELPKYLNELKLIIAPSYTEGGIPTIIKEAMACGTLILVTPVAGVGIIKDSETGFILEHNSPECIAKNVIRVLEHPEPEEIINRARNLVEKEFSYEKEVKQYRNMLYGVLYDRE